MGDIRIGISDGKGGVFVKTPWRKADGTHKAMAFNHAVVILGFHPNAKTPFQMDFVGLNKEENLAKYMASVTDWANNDVAGHKGSNAEVWWVYVKVKDTKSMKPFGKIMAFHDGSAEARTWAENVEATIKASSMETLTRRWGKAPWAELKAQAAEAVAAVGVPGRKIRKPKVVTIPAPVDAKPKRVRRPVKVA